MKHQHRGDQWPEAQKCVTAAFPLYLRNKHQTVTLINTDEGTNDNSEKVSGENRFKNVSAVCKNTEWSLCVAAAENLMMFTSTFIHYRC